MPATPLLTFDELIGALRRLGYEIARQTGSHVRLRCPDRRPVTVPRKREIPRGTLRAILRTADIEVAEFLELLGR